ncbi:MAG: heme NO-binding domain-containing protein [Bacteroidia bacterium]|nr:heme NO-binding domain-containing protein [Bacteroidia bacterium]
MKGIVFTEFLDFVEEHHGILTVDKIIENSNLDSGGIYTTVGTYSHFEMVSLVTQLSKELEVEITDLLRIYGEHFFSVLLKSYPAFFENQNDCFEFLSSLDSYIHPEVLKLYPDAELPSFDTISRSEDHLRMLYTSNRALYSFAEGLIKGTFNFFQFQGELKVESVIEDGKKVQFVINKN